MDEGRVRALIYLYKYQRDEAHRFQMAGEEECSEECTKSAERCLTELYKIAFVGGSRIDSSGFYINERGERFETLYQAEKDEE